MFRRRLLGGFQYKLYVEFRSVGLYDGKQLKDIGRAAISKNPADIGKFKIGALRNVDITAPYMHNGMFKPFPSD
jgi:cytochrome c peroxidase